MIKTLRFSSMKSWLPWILLACFYIGKSQTKRFDINWADSIRMSTTSGAIELPSFNPENYSFSDTKGLTFSAEWNVNGLIDETSA